MKTGHYAFHPDTGLTPSVGLDDLSQVTVERAKQKHKMINLRPDQVDELTNILSDILYQHKSSRAADLVLVAEIIRKLEGRIK